LIEEPDPWEQLVGESQRAYAAFCAYRDLGPERSLLKAFRQQKGKEAAKTTDGTWTGWSSTFRWSERVKAYDTAVEKKRRETLERERENRVREMRARAEATGKRLQTTAEKILDALDTRLEIPLRVDAKAIPSLLRAAADVAGKGVNLELDALGLRDYLEGRDVSDDDRSEDDEEALQEWEDTLASEEGGHSERRRDP
jgi:hypothetical protein